VGVEPSVVLLDEGQSAISDGASVAHGCQPQRQSTVVDRIAVDKALIRAAEQELRGPASSRHTQHQSNRTEIQAQRSGFVPGNLPRICQLTKMDLKRGDAEGDDSPDRQTSD
jgi:hypothetical protein